MACDTIKIETLDADEVVSIVTAGPQGPSGAEAATLTTTGDLLYRAALANDRLPIGSEGQVLKVSSGLPAWGNESGSVTSVAGRTGDVTLAVADVAGAQSRLTDLSLGTISTSQTLSAARYTRVRFRAVTSGLSITLPDTNLQDGDIFILQQAPGGQATEIKFPGGALLETIGSNESVAVFYLAAISNWSIFPVGKHTHPASDITSGTLTHERGGLEADVSAYNGLLKIASGSTSAVTVTAAGEALLDDADASAQRTTLGLGNSATLDTGTTAGTVAEGNHTHTQLHDKSHSMTDATSHTAGNHKVFYSNGSGEVVELALGNSGEVLTSNGASAAPSFAAASGGVSAVNSTLADILSVSGSDLVADDLGGDKLYGWDDSASKAIGFATVGPTFDGTTLRWPVELVVACSDETSDLTTGTAKVTFRAPYAFLLTGVRASVNTAPTGSTLIVDINNGANSALSTKLSIDATEKTSATAATAAVIDTTYDDFSDDAEITIDIDQIGSTIAGKGLKVTLIGTRA